MQLRNELRWSEMAIVGFRVVKEALDYLKPWRFSSLRLFLIQPFLQRQNFG